LATSWSCGTHRPALANELAHRTSKLAHGRPSRATLANDLATFEPPNLLVPLFVSSLAVLIAVAPVGELPSRSLDQSASSTATPGCRAQGTWAPTSPSSTRHPPLPTPAQTCLKATIASYSFGLPLRPFSPRRIHVIASCWTLQKSGSTTRLPRNGHIRGCGLE